MRHRHRRITGLRALELLQSLEHWLGEHELMENPQGLRNKHVIQNVRDALKEHVLADLQRSRPTT